MSEKPAAEDEMVARFSASWQDGDIWPDVQAVAALRNLDPEVLDWHVEAVHGWEPHNEGYRAAVHAAADCLEADNDCARKHPIWRPPVQGTAIGST